MSEIKRGLTPEEEAEWTARFLAVLNAEPKPKPKPPTEVVKLVPKPAEPLQKIIQDSEKAETWFEKETRRLEQAHREFEEEQERLARDPARSNHYNAAYRRSIGQVSPGHERYYQAGEALAKTREARLAQSRYQSLTVGRGDSDADLHVRPEDQVWSE